MSWSGFKLAKRTGNEAGDRAQESALVVGLIEVGGALAALIVWATGKVLGQLSQFDAVGLPVLILFLALTGVATWARPTLIMRSRALVLIVLLAYFQSSLFVAFFCHPPLEDDSAISRIGLATPLLYLASFALLLRRSHVLPLVQAILTALQCAVVLIFFRSHIGPQTTLTVVTLIVIQPLYLAILFWIDMQRRHNIDAQQAATASKLMVLGMISHELRSPLQTIVAALDSLQRRFSELNLPASELQNILRIRSSSAQLNSHLADLIVITKQAVGLAPAKEEPFRLDWLLMGLVENYRGAAQDRSTHIVLDIPEACQAVVGDSMRVQQIMNNLLNNAVKYTKKGQIDIAVRKVASGVELIVQDTGIGIDETKVPEIWEPYVRLSSDPSVALAEGSGLGLTVVRLLVDMLKGELRLESQPGEGTRISLSLPLHLKPSP